MKKFIIFFAITIGWIFCLTALSGAQVPELKEQLAYSLNVFNGRGYTGGFTPQAEDTIYLIADKDNAISPRITLVYFWPITGKYIASFEALNEEVEGTLEVLQGEKVINTLKKEDDSRYYSEEYGGEASHLYRGEEARAYYEKFEKAVEEYYKQTVEYQKAQTEYEKNFNDFLQELMKRTEAGEEIKKEEIEKRMPRKPKPPNPPQFYVMPPTKDYIINLPVGRYKIRLRAEDGTIIQDSEKNLVLFTSRRTGGTGYEIIPGNRWTNKESCDDPSGIIYAAGENTLYFNPFIQDEYNELYYNKLEDPQSEGREEGWRWVHVKSIKDVTLLFKGKEIFQRIERVPYYVKEISGAELGYEIIEFNPEEMVGSATFEGYKLELSSTLQKTNYEINLEKKEGGLFQGGGREVRLVRKEKAKLLYILSLFPLGVGLLVFVGRKRKRIPKKGVCFQ